MLNSISRYIFILLFTSLFSFAYAQQIDKIVMFGDSLSDNGNIFSLTTKAHRILSSIPIIPKNPPYYEGRFSNGPIWIDHLSQVLNVPLEDYAYGGAWAEPLINSRISVPFGLSVQVSYYLVTAITDFHKKNHLYIIWVGGNDYVAGRSDVDYATTNTVETIRNEIEWLTYYGAHNILIMNLPDLSVVPEVISKGTDNVEVVKQLVALHNEKLTKMVAEEQEKYPDDKIMLGDITTYFNDTFYNHDKYNIKNVNEPCFNGSYYRQNLIDQREVSAMREQNIDMLQSPSLRTAYMAAKLADNGTEACANPDEYMFWDQIHPTRLVHHLMGLDAVTILAKNDIQGQPASRK